MSDTEQFREPTKMILPNKVEMDENNLIRLNMAKAREALECLNDISFSSLKFPLDGDSSEIYGADKKMITLPMWMIALILNATKIAQDKAKAALSVPARNIEGINTYEDMCEAWNNHVRATHKTDVELFFAYLFAEAKGGEKDG